MVRFLVLGVISVFTMPALAEQPSDAVAASEEGTPSKPTDNDDSTSHDGSRFKITFDGDLHIGYSTFTPNRFFGVQMSSSNSRNPYVGRNDGFELGKARLNLRARYNKNISIRLGYDGSLLSYSSHEDVIGELDTGLKDAYLTHSLGTTAQVSVGRFKPPFDVEELTANEDLQFVNKALESRGVHRHEGYSGDVPGLAPGRQLGLMVLDNALATMGGLSLGYALAMTNGNSGDAGLNDNDLPAFWGRFTLGWGKASLGKNDSEGPAGASRIKDGGKLGLSGYVNKQTLGTPPNRFHDMVQGYGVDLALTYWNVSLQGQILLSDVEHLQADAGAKEKGLGGHVQLAYTVLDSIDLAYRLAIYNPRWVVEGSNSGDAADYDQVTHHTVGVRCHPKDSPLIGFLEYTHAVEEEARMIENDRVQIALHVKF